MSADPLGGVMGGALQQHSFVDEPLMQVHQTVAKPDFWLDSLVEESLNWRLETQLDNIEQQLTSAHNLTGLNSVRANYGFTGVGQTVAIIDSGIAYDHYALGGGFGSNYRVVGGWDFTEEKDANPYDDGPEGSHGTHVAGIVGSTGNTTGGDVGVAPGVDLVGLRVFNDAGAGYFSWVEQALQWVHANRNSFENPITAINLSLGTTWNSITLPNWTTLEDEFAQLEADGIFIAVSAGNSFTSYNTPGLSYPAASSHVVPVMSIDDSGALSYFSQRHTSAIAAPGRYVRSTVPDYAGNHNGVADDWANFSGTSMASPYVAGASVLVREAMQFVGYTNITQDTIYDHMMATADSFFDSATSLSYKRLNLASAIDALMPVDDFGSSVVDAYNFGSLGGDLHMSGHVASLNDADYFTFTASATGQFTFSTTTTHQLATGWDAATSGGAVNAGQFTLDVVAGQSYTFGLTSAGGIGYYDLNATFAAGMTFIDWGAVVGQSNYRNLTATGEQWYRIVAGQTGYLTSTAQFASGNLSLAYYNADGQMLASGGSVAGGQRVDMLATSGQEVYLRVAGSSSAVDMTCTNLVSVAGNQLSVSGTAGNDTVAIAIRTNSLYVSVNNVSYSYAAGTITNVSIAAGAGTDSITMTGSNGDETVGVATSGITFDSIGMQLSATGFENVMLYSGGGLDTVTLYGTNGNEQYTGFNSHSTLAGLGFTFVARDFANVIAIAGGGNDSARLYDSAGDDVFEGWSDRVVISGSNFSRAAHGFDQTLTFATTGNDVAHLYDTAGNDVFTTWWNRAIMYGAGYWNDIRGFDHTSGYATAGFDSALLRDSAGDDDFTASPGQASMVGSNYLCEAIGFDRCFGFASTGNDVATLTDGAGDDIFTTWYNRAVLYGTNFWNDARGFDSNLAIATTGNDLAYMRDTPGDDLFSSWTDRATLTGSGITYEVLSFDHVVAFSSSGNDSALLRDSAGDDIFTNWPDRALMYGSGYRVDARGFGNVTGIASTGNDIVAFRDSAGDDRVRNTGSTLLHTGNGFAIEAVGFGMAYFYDLFGGDDDDVSLNAYDEVFNLYDLHST